jgi:glycosyltransferase involved in cell wall biosynthesis
MSAAAPTHRLLSVVTPAFNESANLPSMHARLCAVLDTAKVTWDWIVVDDHSTDDTFSVVQRLAFMDPRVRGCRLARNAGSHAAVACGLAVAGGDAVVVLVADGQDPPEILPELLNAWSAGAQVVWAARTDVPPSWTSRTYYTLMRRTAGLSGVAPMGADCVLIDRAVVDALQRFGEQHVNLLALISWMGFRQVHVPCPRVPRAHGRSGWTFRKKLKLLVDSVTGFTYLPIRLMTYIGAGTAVAGLGYAVVVMTNALLGDPPAGWSSLMVAVLLIGGLQMIMLGVLGEYLWRTLEESRRRPRFLIEATTASPERPLGSIEHRRP